MILLVDSDHHVHDLEWNDTGKWSNFDLTSFSGGVPVASGGALTSFLDTIWPDRLILYVGSDQNVHDLVWSNNGAWHNFDLTAFTGGVPVASGGALTSFLDTIWPDRLILYVGSDQHVHDLEWSNNGAWHNFDLTALTGGVPVASGGALTSFLDTIWPDRLIFYVGSDQHVHDLEWSNNGAWHNFDLTALTGGVPVASGGALTSFLDTIWPDRLIFYVGSDQHVHDLEWNNNGAWHNFDLTALSGGVPVAPGGALTSFLDRNWPDRLIFYIGSDQHVHDLEWNNSGSWNSFDISR